MCSLKVLLVKLISPASVVSLLSVDAQVLKNLQKIYPYDQFFQASLAERTRSRILQVSSVTGPQALVSVLSSEIYLLSLIRLVSSISCIHSSPPQPLHIHHSLLQRLSSTRYLQNNVISLHGHSFFSLSCVRCLYFLSLLSSFFLIVMLQFCTSCICYCNYVLRLGMC